MSTNRRSAGGWVHPQRLTKGPNGRAMCRNCDTEVPKGRRTFCGDECVDQWRIRTDPGYARDAVYARDRGICAECGMDTDRVYEAISLAKRMIHNAGWGQPRGQRDHKTGHGHTLIGSIGSLVPSGRISVWDADHIVPVIEGGGECGIDNYRTLCIWCHREATKHLARRRAEQRKEARGDQ